LRFHAASLASPFDADGQVPLDQGDFRDLFLRNTPWRSYVGRAAAAFSVDYRDRLDRVDVPTLVLTPQHDTLIGEQAADTMLQGIPDATEIVLPATGHMFRFTHPVTYARAIDEFLAERVDRAATPAMRG
jgi:pimeloyl-ACP methyl ester carboxylesterase